MNHICATPCTSARDVGIRCDRIRVVEMKQIRLTTRTIKFESCYDCPLTCAYTLEDDIRAGLWFWCRVGGTIPTRTPLIEVKLPKNCPAEDVPV